VIHKIFEILSLGLSVVTIILCLSVVLVWRKPALMAIRGEKPIDAQGWFIIGVFVGFVGESLDNLYWLIPWTSSYLGLEATSDLMDFGVYPNVPFRQILGSFAAYCHIRSHFTFSGNKDRRHDKILGYGILAGICYSLSVVFAGMI
jgi:hypothetical protein